MDSAQRVVATGERAKMSGAFPVSTNCGTKSRRLACTLVLPVLIIFKIQRRAFFERTFT
jgi:hypothetical protein